MIRMSKIEDTKGYINIYNRMRGQKTFVEEKVEMSSNVGLREEVSQLQRIGDKG